MLELLAAIQSADPPSLVLWSLFLLAAGMYPVGFMLGASCSPCCGCPNVTITLSGYEDEVGPSEWLAPLVFSSDFGSGATAHVSSPGQNSIAEDPLDAAGPVAGVSLTDGGSGYARIARVEPAVTVSASGGSGAALSAELAETVYDGRPAWQVDSVSVSSGGTGYPATGSVAFSVASGGTEVQQAGATFYCGRVEPTVAVSAGGSGSGAVLSATLSQGLDMNGLDVWSVSAIAITSGGSGYAEFDPVSISVTDGEGSWFYGEVASVDQDGAITAISISFGGEYFKGNGVIQSVQIDYVYGGGIYYKDDPSLPGEKATVTASANQSGPTAGIAGGAAFSVEIDDDASSETFGQIVSVAVTNGGIGYLAYAQRYLRCATYYNGRTIVLPSQKAPGGECIFGRLFCNIDHQYVDLLDGIDGTVFGQVVAPAATPDRPLGETLDQVTVGDPPNGWTATNESGITAVCEIGGDDDPAYMTQEGTNWFPCCRGDSEPPQEVEVELRVRQNGEWSFHSNAVLSRAAAGGGCSNEWAILIPGGPRVSLVIQQCQDNAGVCNSCWRQCEAFATVYYGFPYHQSCTLRFSEDQCAHCEESPTCGPPAGEYICDNIYNPSGFCSDGNEAWKIIVT